MCVGLSSQPFVVDFMCVCVCVPGGDLQSSSGTLDEGLDEVDDDAEWEEEREQERTACEGEDFVPPKIMASIRDPSV